MKLPDLSDIPTAELLHHLEGLRLIDHKMSRMRRQVAEAKAEGRDFDELIRPALREVEGIVAEFGVPIVVPWRQTVGAPYQVADEDAAVTDRDPQAVDPAIVERGTRAHARTQNMLAESLRDFAIEPRSPTPTDPNFDLAWSIGATDYVAEIKSITDKNETKQLRLGLGQVLWVRHQLSRRGKRTVAVLVAEREPKSRDWQELCDSVGVVLIWPDLFAQWIRELRDARGGVTKQQQ